VTSESRDRGSAPEEEKAAPFTESVLQRLTGRSVASGRYEIRGEIARGGMGVVLRVWDEDLRRSLAMKVILGKGEVSTDGGTPPVDSRLLARFLEEAQVTGQLDHPGIVPVHELGLDASGQVYFTMKLVKGQTLKDVFDLVRDGQEGWTRTRALGVLLKVCEAMAYAHDKGVIHRDLKPGNVMVGKYGEVYVMDWGLARVVGQADERDLRVRPEAPRTSSALQSERATSRGETPDSPLYTMDGDVVGTPAYMSPEQARGELAAMGPHSDVYALGAMLYHLLAGHMPHVPYGALLNNYAVWSAVQNGPPPGITSLAPDAPAELVAICEKAMAREVGERYRDMSALAKDLAAFVEGRVVAAYQTGAWAETKKWVQRNKPLAASLAAGVVLLVIGLATSLTLGARAERNARLAANSEELALEKVAEAESLRADAVVREEAATARADVLWAIEELKNFHTLDDDLVHARLQDRPTYVWWLEKARELVYGRPVDPLRGLRKRPGLPDHQRLFAEMRKSFGSTKEELAADGRRSERIDSRRGVPLDREKQWWNANLGQLEQDLLELEQRIKVAERSVTDPEGAQAWNVAIEAIAASPKYGGQRITPQLELLPLGPDPDSGLWEFAHLGTGEPALRASDGKIMLGPENGIVFVLLPSGRVPVEDGKSQSPLNEVQLDPFFLSKYEMTVEQWKRTSLTSQPSFDSPLLPANAVSWDDCVATLERAGLFLRLPTEAQWEYGCRAGTTTPWWTGADEDSLRFAANIDFDLQDNRRGEPKAIGGLLANPFGLHDVHGNVAEWSSDEYGDESVAVRPGDGKRQASGSGTRVYRGGGYGAAAVYARSGDRYGSSPDYRVASHGLRLTRYVTP